MESFVYTTVSVCLFARVCVRQCVFVRVHTHTDRDTNTDTPLQTHAHRNTSSPRCLHVHSRVSAWNLSSLLRYAYLHVCEYVRVLYVCVRMPVSVCLWMCIDTHTGTHTGTLPGSNWTLARDSSSQRSRVILRALNNQEWNLSFRMYRMDILHFMTGCVCIIICKCISVCVCL